MPDLGRTLTPAQIATVAKAAGFRGDALAWAVAVALAESGGRTHAVGVNTDKSRDRGLWQINSKWHPEVSDAQAFNETSAARAAYRISSAGTNWTPWAAYNSGAANAYLSRARVAAAQAGDTSVPGTGSGTTEGGTGGSGGLADAAGSIASVAKSLASLVSTWIKAAKWIANPHNWVRIMEVTGGAVLVVIAITIMGRSGAGPVASGINTVQQLPVKVAKTAAQVVPVGKVTKLVK